MQSFTAHMPLLMATSAFGLGRRCWSSPQQCYLHCLCTVFVTEEIMPFKPYVKTVWHKLYFKYQLQLDCHTQTHSILRPLYTSTYVNWHL